MLLPEVVKVSFGKDELDLTPHFCPLRFDGVDDFNDLFESLTEPARNHLSTERVKYARQS